MNIIHHADGTYDIIDIKNKEDLSLILSSVITVDRFAELYPSDTRVKVQRHVLVNEIKYLTGLQ